MTNDFARARVASSFYYALNFMYYAPGFKNYARLFKATNYDAGIMYTSLGFMPSFLHVLAVSNSTSSTSTVCRVREIWSHRITNAYVPKP